MELDHGYSYMLIPSQSFAYLMLLGVKRNHALEKVITINKIVCFRCTYGKKVIVLGKMMRNNCTANIAHCVSCVGMELLLPQLLLPSIQIEISTELQQYHIQYISVTIISWWT